MDFMFIIGLIALTIAISATALFFYIRPAKNEYGHRTMTPDEEDNLEAVEAVCWFGWVITLSLLTSFFISTG